MVEGPRIVEEVEQDGLVIALEEMRLEALRQAAEQRLDHATAVRPAIDIVAEKHERATFGLIAVSRIGLDPAEQRFVQIAPAMNISHRVKELAFRQCGMRETWRGRERHRGRTLRQSARSRHPNPASRLENWCRPSPRQDGTQPC